MNLTGQHTLNAATKTIWDMMMDPVILARVTPGITRLERIDEENYKSIAEVKIGPVSGAFTGSVKVTNKDEPNNFTLVVAQNSKIGNASASVKMSFKSVSPTQTEVSFNGDVQLSGTLAVMGGRVVAPVANMLSKQFFNALEKEVSNSL
jgi:uncharacterized protein